MNISAEPLGRFEPVNARVCKGKLIVDLADRRTISVPLEWFPRLAHGTAAEHRNFTLNHYGIHWPDLNEDIAVEDLLAGRKSGESPRSIRRWLRYRSQGLKEPIPEIPLPPDLQFAVKRILAAEKRSKSKSARRRAS